MIELRWLETFGRLEMDRKLTLQYRVQTSANWLPPGVEWGWTDWQDVPTVTEDEAKTAD